MEESQSSDQIKQTQQTNDRVKQNCTSIADRCSFGRTPLRTANNSPLIGGVNGSSAPSSCKIERE